MTNAIIGGILIGISVSMMLLFNGKVTGISGIVGGMLKRGTNDRTWRFLFLTGLISGGLFFRLFNYNNAVFNIQSTGLHFDYIIAGLLVGFGTLMGNGCTSGHGVCGISRFSPRSIIATIIFIISGILSVALFKFLRGGL